MKPDLRPYTEWEDFQAGMYRDAQASDRELMIEKAASLLSDAHRLFAAMRLVTMKWRFATEANLHESPNNRAWLGQAACCYEASVPEELTRVAWGRLNNKQRIAANRIADHAIDEWRRRTKRNPQMVLFDV